MQSLTFKTLMMSKKIAADHYIDAQFSGEPKKTLTDFPMGDNNVALLNIKREQEPWGWGGVGTYPVNHQNVMRDKNEALPSGQGFCNHKKQQHPVKVKVEPI